MLARQHHGVKAKSSLFNKVTPKQFLPLLLWLPTCLCFALWSSSGLNDFNNFSTTQKKQMHSDSTKLQPAQMLCIFLTAATQYAAQHVVLSHFLLQYVHIASKERLRAKKKSVIGVSGQRIPE